MSNNERSSEFETNDYITTSCASSAEVDFSYSPTKTPQEENMMIPFTEQQQEVFVSEDSERQILLLMLLAQVCALHDATPRTFTVHVLSLFERGILDHHSIRFLFDLDLVPQDALADFNHISALHSTTKTADRQPEHSTITTTDNNSALVPYKSGCNREDSCITTGPLTQNDTANVDSQQQVKSSDSVVLQHTRERKIREASVSAIRKVLERNDSNESSLEQKLTTRSYSGNTTATSVSSNNCKDEYFYPVVEEAALKDNIIMPPPLQPNDDDLLWDQPNGTTSTNNNHFASSVVLTPSISSSWSVEHHPLCLSRYQRDFTQIRKLAAGSFGEVYHVINKLDHRDYAIKRVLFTATGYSNETVHLVLREVRCLAQCDHINCVRYYTSWLEPSWMTGSGLTVSTPDQIAGVNRATQQKVLTDIHQLVVLTATTENEKQKTNEEDEIVKKHLHHIDELLFGGRHHYQLRQPSSPEKYQKRILSASQGDSSFSNSSSSSSGLSDEDVTIGRNEPYYCNGGSSIGFTFQESTNGNRAVCDVEDKQDKRTEEQQKALVPASSNTAASRYNYQICLFIQMQLCHSRTLSDWIQQRNLKHRDEVDIHQWALDVYQVFRQIVCGLAHVHGKGIIHRDLKPANIFAADDNIFKIGDFGLSKLLMLRNSPNSDGRLGASVPQDHWVEGHSNTVGVGTLTYASPEQISSEIYCSKADIFSLGLILLELCSYFSTEHEKLKVFRELRTSHTVPPSIERSFPAAAALILACTDPDPQKRPSAKDILSDDIFQESNHEILRLKVELRKKDLALKRCQTMIDDLRRQLAES